MISLLRRKRAGRAPGKGQQAELSIPNHFQCPTSLELMKDPVTWSTGISFDRESIEKWIEAGNVTCPATKQELRSIEPIPNHTLRQMIQDWCVEKRSNGVERIPTPRTPISSNQVIEHLEKITMARDQGECHEFVGKLIKAMKESDRNKKCILGNEASRTLAFAFQSFANCEGEGVVLLLEDILSGLASASPLDLGTVNSLKTARSLGRILWFLQRGGVSGRRNAALILKDLVLSSKVQREVFDALMEIEGATEALVKLLKEPICPASTKASLVIIYHMITSIHPSNVNNIARFVKLGLVSLILDILMDAQKSISEKALGVLDSVCRYKVGIEVALGHGSTVPIVVTKILGVSNLATEFSVSILWRLVNENEKRSESRGVAVEALQVGAFQKLLLVLQVGSTINERTREKVSKMLKILNQYRDRVECIESMDFKDLKRPF